MLLFGGTSFPFGHNTSNELYSLFTRDGNFNLVLEKASGDIPPPCYGSAFISAGDSFTHYLIGGTTGKECFNHIWKLESYFISYTKYCFYF